MFNGSPAEVLSGGWPLHISANAPLTSPVLDDFMGRIYIGDAKGVFFLVRTATGDNCTGAISPPCVDSTTLTLGTNSAIDDGPILDVTNQKVYAFDAGSGTGGTNFTVTQATETLGSPVTATVGAAKTSAKGFTGAFDDKFWTVGPSSGHLYVCGTDSSSTVPALWEVGFNGSGLMNSAGTELVLLSGANNVGCSPLTEFLNGATDRLFVSVDTKCAFPPVNAGNDGCIISFDITTPLTPVTAGTPAGIVDEVVGTSGIVVDNVSSSVGASSIYFSTLAGASASAPCGGVTTGGGCGVKLTQSGLQ